MSFAEVAKLAYVTTAKLPPQTEGGLEAITRYSTPSITWANACHICTVEITDTSEVKLLRYIVSEDCGVMINPMVVEGQISGGVVQGIGAVIHEGFVYDEDGNPLTTTFLDYLIPTTTDIPRARRSATWRHRPVGPVATKASAKVARSAPCRRCATRSPTRSPVRVRRGSLRRFDRVTCSNYDSAASKLPRRVAPERFG